MGSPIDSWEGVTAYFSFANNEAVMLLFLILAMAMTVLTIVVSVVHERSSYARFSEDGSQPAAPADVYPEETLKEGA